MIKQFLRWLHQYLCRLPGLGPLIESVASTSGFRRRRSFRQSSKRSQRHKNRQSHRSSRQQASGARSPFPSQLGRPLGKYPSIGQSISRSMAHPHANDPERVVYSVSRSEIIDTLNQMLKQAAPSDLKKDSAHLLSWEESLSARLSSRPRTANNRSASPWASSTLTDDPTDTAIRYADYPETLEDLSNAAYLCECQRRYGEAEQLYKQVLQLQQQRLGTEHLKVATSLSDLATLYCSHNRYNEAQPLLQQALTIRQQQLLAGHKDLGDTFYKLAKTYRHQEAYGKAEPLFQQALDTFRQQFGPEHPETQAVYADLMQMIATAIEGGKFAELNSELPPLDLSTLGETYSWAKPSWQK